MRALYGRDPTQWDLRLLVEGVSSFGYLDLGRLARLRDRRNTPFTPAVHAGYALVEALHEFEEQGGGGGAAVSMPHWHAACLH